MRRLLKALTFLAVTAIAGACAAGVQPPATGVGAAAPAVAVERFLQLAGEDEYLQMGWVFGTADGAILQRDTPSDVEKRMYALATVLQNDGFVVGTGMAVPGRVGAAQRFNVRIQQRGREVQVPITTVSGPGGRWLVEQVEVQAITGQQ